MKKVIFVLMILSVLALSGCDEHYPFVRINTGVTASYIDIDIGNPYIYKGFDIENTDGGKDLILHFAEGDG